jgi:GNAT superfamily N-acetyltransferase
MSAPWRVASLATLAVLLWQMLIWNGRHQRQVSGFFDHGAYFQLPPGLAVTTRVNTGTGYDGQFYRLVAHDPLDARRYSRYMDDPRHRSGRILLPAAAHLLGSAAALGPDAAFVILILVSIFAGTLLTARLLHDAARPAWYALALPLLPGVLTSIDRMLVESTVLALIAGVVRAEARGQWAAAVLCGALAPLARETGLLAPSALFVHATRCGHWRRATAAALAVLPWLAWSGWLTVRFPSGPASGIVSWPLAGYLVRLVSWKQPHQIHSPAASVVWNLCEWVAIVGVLLCFALGVRLLLTRGASTLALPAAGFTALGLVLTAPSHLYAAFGFARPITPLLWILALDGIRCRRWLPVATAFSATPSVLLPLGAETLQALGYL